MKKLKFLAAAALVVIVALVLAPRAALAAFAPTRILNLYVLNKLLIGNATESNAITETGSASATVDFSSAYDGVQFSSAITVTGAVAGDTCTVGVPAAAAALKAKFKCYVTAADEVKIAFEPGDITLGQVALSSASPSTATATVSAGSICTCTPVGATAAIAAAGCATGVSSTTLTLTGPNTVTTTMTYRCAAPVDPASGTFYVRTFSAQ